MEDGLKEEQRGTNDVSHVKELISKKENIEEEIKALLGVLKTQNVGMDDALVDKEGFPRSDIDVHSVRIARNKIICLRNDLNSIMKEIENGLHVLHASARDTKKDTSEEKMDTSHDDELNPFLKVDLVSQGSPAEKAGVKLNDLILRFGTITHENFNGLQSIGTLVQHSKGSPLPLIVKRDGTIKHLTLTPNTWSGRGLLGCNVVLTK